MTDDQIKQRAEDAARHAWEYSFHNKIQLAQDIAEYIDEPAILLEEIIKVVYTLPPAEALQAIRKALDSQARNYANRQSELAYNAAMHSPQ